MYSSASSTMSIPIPDELRRYFWEYDSDALRWPDHRKTIIAKLMRDGGDDAARWLLEHVPARELRGWILSRQGRGLSPERLCFWASKLDLPRTEVRSWIARWNDSVWGRRTR